MSSPFRPEELTVMKYKDKDGRYRERQVVLIAGRIRVARENLPGLELDCEMIERTDDIAVVKVRATWTGATPGKSSGLGVSLVSAEKPHMARWAVCLAETRARHRALSAAGIGTEYYGLEELPDADEATEAPAARPAPPQKPAPTSPPPANKATWRKALSDRMIRMFGSTEAAIVALQHITGHRSTSTLNDQDQAKIKTALDLIEQNGCNVDKTRELVRDFFHLPWFNEMSDAEFDIIRNTMNGPRDPHTTTGAPPF